MNYSHQSLNLKIKAMSKKNILTTVFAFAVIVAHAQIKVFTGGKVFFGYTGSTAPTYLIDLYAGTNNDVNTSSTNGYRINGTYMLWNNNKAGCIYVGQGGTTSSNTGINNTFVGFESGKVNSSGNKNHFSGTYAGTANTTGSYCTYDGYLSGASNISGLYNTCIGYNAGYYNTTSSYNTLMGNQAGFDNTAAHNTLIGNVAGENLTSGGYNTIVGSLAGNTYTTTTTSTFIGYNADGNAIRTNSAAIGSNAIAIADNKMYFGDANVTGCYNFNGTWLSFSDGRFKFNVQENVSGLDFIKRLRPITYQFNTQEIDAYVRQGMSQEADSLIENQPVRNFEASTNIIHSGFIAQEVEQAAIETGFLSTIVSAPTNDTEPYALNYGEFVVPLVKAIQEQQTKIEELEAMIRDCCAAPKSLNTIQGEGTQQEQNLRNGATGINTATQVVELSYSDNVILYQNIPNPFGEETTINYYLPQIVNNAKMVFYNDMGKSIKEVVLENKGNASVVLKTSELATGVYSYSIVVDGKTADTKRMLKNK